MCVGVAAAPVTAAAPAAIFIRLVTHSKIHSAASLDCKRMCKPHVASAGHSRSTRTASRVINTTSCCRILRTAGVSELVTASHNEVQHPGGEGPSLPTHKVCVCLTFHVSTSAGPETSSKQATDPDSAVTPLDPTELTEGRTATHDIETGEGGYAAEDEMFLEPESTVGARGTAAVPDAAQIALERKILEDDPMFKPLPALA